MSVVLENDYLKVMINEKGAELRHVENRKTKLEYMWSGDPAFWAKTSPILFPIVGTLKNDSYLYNGKLYSLTRHGFARDMIFQVADHKDDEASFFILSNKKLHEKYPFDFRLEVMYKITKDQLAVTYNVENTGEGPMYFSIGAHPAFKVPLTTNSTYEDYYLHFEVEENVPRWPISADGLLKDQPVAFLSNSSSLQLSHQLFREDALVFKNLRSKKISIQSKKHEHGLEFFFDGFPLLGIWSAGNAEFVCIEPWCGVADSESHDQQLEKKEGIIRLTPGRKWTRTWTARFY